jgi:hypothetical protein
MAAKGGSWSKSKGGGMKFTPAAGGAAVADNTSELQAKAKQLEERLSALEAENKQLKSQASGPEQFDEPGFWLKDKNFERANFADFGVPDDALEMESRAEAFYKNLAKKYHPDKGGSAEQMQNINKLRKQMLSIVKLNGGMGL